MSFTNFLLARKSQFSFLLRDSCFDLQTFPDFFPTRCSKFSWRTLESSFLHTLVFEFSDLTMKFKEKSYVTLKPIARRESLKRFYVISSKILDFCQRSLLLRKWYKKTSENCKTQINGEQTLDKTLFSLDCH